MKKRTAQGIALGSGIACLLAEGALLGDFLSLPLALGVLVVATPVFVLALFSWWSAKGKEGDIPFMGY